MSKPIIPKFKPHERIEYVYPAIREKLNELEDPDLAFEWLAYCIHSGMITAGKAQKMFDLRFPKETQDFFKERVVEAIADAAKETQRLKEEAIKKRVEAMENLGLDPQKFEKEMEALVIARDSESRQE